MSKRGKYVRVCVQVDLAKPLILAYTSAEKKYNVVYEFIHQLCFKYSKVGYKADLCKEQTDLINVFNEHVRPEMAPYPSTELTDNGKR